MPNWRLGSGTLPVCDHFSDNASVTDTLPPSFAPTRRSARASVGAPIPVGGASGAPSPSPSLAFEARPTTPRPVTPRPVLTPRATNPHVVSRQSYRAAAPVLSPTAAAAHRPGSIPPASVPPASVLPAPVPPASVPPRAASITPGSLRPSASPAAVPPPARVQPGLPSNRLAPAAYPPRPYATPAQQPGQFRPGGQTYAPAPTFPPAGGSQASAYPAASHPAAAFPAATYPAAGYPAAGYPMPAGAIVANSAAEWQPNPAAQPPNATQPEFFNTAPPRKRKRKVGRLIVLSLVILLVGALAWPVSLLFWANGQIQHMDALSGAPNTPGTTFLLVGSDERSEDGWVDEVVGARTDTIMLLHQPRNGTTSLISLPRDSFVEIPGRSSNKINAAYAFGGAPLLVETVENLTGLTIDHYVEVGMGGLMNIVDVVGGVELCMDRTVNDEFSQLNWTAGCHHVDGFTALAFSRMRHADPLGDIGRVQRQQQVISAITHAVARPDLLWHPTEQRSLLTAGLGSIRADYDTNILNFGTLALAFRAANGAEGFRGTPPISNPDYRPGNNVGSTVQLDPATIGQFWADVRNGTLPPSE